MKQELLDQIVESKRSRQLKMEHTGLVVQRVEFMSDARNALYWHMLVTMQLPFRAISPEDLEAWFLETYPLFPVRDNGDLDSMLPVSYTELLGEVPADDEGGMTGRINWEMKFLGNDRNSLKSPYLILQVDFKGLKKEFKAFSKPYVAEYLDALRWG